MITSRKPGTTTRRPGPIGGHHNHNGRGDSVIVRGVRRTVTDVEATAARRITELMHIVRVYQRVIENNLQTLDATARLAAGDARKRLAEFLEREDVQ